MKKPSKKRKTDAEVKSVLKKIVSIVNRGYKDPNAKRLWDILSALRGPDTPGINAADYKEKTTERIRYALGLEAVMLFTDSKPLIYTPTFHAEITREISSHFADHIAGAVAALRELGYIGVDQGA